MRRIDERIGAVFGSAGVPELLRPDDFVRLAEITHSELASLIESGAISPHPVTRLIPRDEYYRFMFERNLRRAGMSEEVIAHVLDCTS